ncbi:MAG: ATP-dependent Clp protease proteolytic subunit [Bacteroidia bacterium]|nr:ATP-dependent Clp protease proteolytic subunit [Bacteroidia bacterium]
MAKPKFTITAETKGKNAVIHINGYISEWSNHAEGFKMKLDQIIADGIVDAEVYINSGGGDVFVAAEIVNEIGRFTGFITARLGALCASAASRIACACDKVIAAKNTSYMIHKPKGWLDGNSDEIEAKLKLLKNLQKEYLSAYTIKTKLPAEEITAMWKTDYWMDSEEAKNKGFVDEIEGEVDITNEDVQAIASYKGAPKIAASVKTTENTPKTEIEMKEKLMLVLAAFVAADASEAQIIAAVENLKTQAAKADSAEKARAQMEKELNDFKAEAKKGAAEAFVQSCIDKKKILASQKDFFVKAYLSDEEGTKKTLTDMPEATQLSKETSGGAASASTEDRSKWTYADFQDKAPAALAELAEKDPDKYEALFRAHYGK